MPVFKKPRGKHTQAPKGLKHLVLYLSLLPILILTIPIFGLIIWIDHSNRAAERDTHGNTLAMRMAKRAGYFMIDQDRVALQLLAEDFARLPGVSAAAVYDADNNLMAAGDDHAAKVYSPTKLTDNYDDAAIYIQTVIVSQTTYGSVLIYLSESGFSRISLAWVVLPTLISALMLWLLARYTVRRIGQRLTEIRQQLEKDTGARTSSHDPWIALQELLPDQSSPADDAAPGGADARAARHTAAPGNKTHTCYLALANLWNPNILSGAERDDLLRRCKPVLDNICDSYGGRHWVRHDVGLMLVLHAADGNPERGFEAIFAALLMRNLCSRLILPDATDHDGRASFRVGVTSWSSAADTTLNPARALWTQIDRSVVNQAIALSGLAGTNGVAISAGIYHSAGKEQRLLAKATRSKALRKVAGSDGDQPEKAWIVRALVNPYQQLLDSQTQQIAKSSGMSPDTHPGLVPFRLKRRSLPCTGRSLHAHICPNWKAGLPVTCPPTPAQPMRCDRYPVPAFPGLCPPRLQRRPPCAGHRRWRTCWIFPQHFVSRQTLPR